jgi:hypothetical protein
MISPADLAATTASSSTTSGAASPTNDDKRPFDAIADSVAAEATTNSFPVFEDFPPESTPAAPTPSPPTSFLGHRRRRSRNVTEHDLRAFKGLPNRKVFDYVDLVKSLRTPSAPGKLPVAPTSQLGTERKYVPHHQVRATSPPPWAR